CCDQSGTTNRLRLTPSTVETAVHSPLQLFIYQISTSQSSPAAATGTFVHAIAEKYPTAQIGPKMQELKAKFPILAAEAGIEPGWEYDALYAKDRKSVV